MPKRPSIVPTDAEMEILVLLWRHGPLTAGDVQRYLGRIRPTGYTTALKLLQTMHEKGSVTRDDSERAHRYAAAVAEEKTQSQIVGVIADQVFAGSAGKLVLRALSSLPISSTELAQIRSELAKRAKKKRG